MFEDAHWHENKELPSNVLNQKYQVCFESVRSRKYRHLVKNIGNKSKKLLEKNNTYVKYIPEKATYLQ